MADTEEPVMAANSESTETTKVENNGSGEPTANGAGDQVVPVTDSTSAGGEVTKTEQTADSAAGDADDSEPSPLQSKIIRQVEYYFGDANMERDKFLIQETKKDDGWVTLKTLLTFNRLKAMSEDSAFIISALKKSTSGLLELKSDGSAVRRHPTRPLPTEDKQDLESRILYVKGFPTDQTLDDLIEYFDEFGGESVSMRRDAKRQFKGSVFVRFKTEEQAKAYLEPEEMKYKDEPLILRLYKIDYFKKKQNEKLESKQQEVKKKEEFKKQKEQEEKEAFEAKIKKGALLKVTGIGSGCSYEKLKEFFAPFGKVAYVEFTSGDDHATVRFGNENEAKQAWEKAVEAGSEGKVTLDDNELTASVLEGAEEENYWKNFQQEMDRLRKEKKNQFGRGGHRSGHRGGRGFKRRNAGGGSDTSPKKAKAEDG